MPPPLVAAKLRDFWQDHQDAAREYERRSAASMREAQRGAERVANMMRALSPVHATPGLADGSYTSPVTGGTTAEAGDSPLVELVLVNPYADASMSAAAASAWDAADASSSDESDSEGEDSEEEGEEEEEEEVMHVD